MESAAMSTCENCRKPAQLRCGSCSEFQADYDKSYYCSKQCQQAHWPRHKLHCRMVIFYSRVRTLPCDSVPQIVSIAAELRGINMWGLNNMIKYITRVAPSARPQQIYARVFEPGAEVREVVRNFNADPAQYKAEWSTRVPVELQEKCKNGREWEVPITSREMCRSEHVGDNEISPRGAIVYHFKVYPEIFEMLSFDEFLKSCTDGWELLLDFARHRVIKALNCPQF